MALQIISFLILLGLLTRFLYRPFMKYLDGRADDLGRLIRGTEEDRKKAEEGLRASAEELRKTKKEIIGLKESAARDADREKIKTLEEAKKEALSIIERARLDAIKELKTAKDEVREEIASLSVEMAKKILNREIKEKDHRRLIEESIRELTRQRTQGQGGRF